jgi:hypothetical protein
MVLAPSLVVLSVGLLSINFFTQEVLGTGIIFGFRLQVTFIAIAFAVLFKHKHYAEDVASVSH